jgi:hypothetical protein
VSRDVSRILEDIYRLIILGSLKQLINLQFPGLFLHGGNKLVEVFPGHHRLHAKYGKVHAVVADAVLRVVIRPDFLGPIPGAQHSRPQRLALFEHLFA